MFEVHHYRISKGKWKQMFQKVKTALAEVGGLRGWVESSLSLPGLSPLGRGE